MANKRVVLGKVETGDYGLYVSKAGTDIIDSGGNLPSGTNIMFSSSLNQPGGWNLKYKGEFALSSPSTTTPNTQTITHSLGYRPLVVVQYCYANELSGGVATTMRTPFYFYYDIDDEGLEGGGAGTQVYQFGVTYYVSTTQLIVSNYGYHSLIGNPDDFLSHNSNYTGTAYVAYLIFGVQ